LTAARWTRSPAYKLWKTRRKCWNWRKKQAELLKPIDCLIINGDLIDGRGDKSGGTELLTRDRNEQVDMAIAAAELWEAPAILISYGTPYHSGRREDWENQIAKGVGATKIGSHDWADVNGLVFDYRHKIGRSSIPHGRHTAAARERMWNVLWAERREYPKASVILRSHVHYFAYCGSMGWLSLTTPALQAYGTKFGARQVSGDVDYGLLSFDVTSKEEWSWEWHILRFPGPLQHVVTI
jgi:hypothetical protein